MTEPSDGSPVRVFVSYSRSDTEPARLIINELRKYMLVAFDYQDAPVMHGDWVDTIWSELDRSSAVLVLLSHNYLKSDNCILEARLIEKLRLTRSGSEPLVDIFPIFLDPIVLPAGWAKRGPSASFGDLTSFHWNSVRDSSRIVRSVIESMSFEPSSRT